ncbi:MAG TPA: hypothetical protein VJY62_12795 [Bacteroidia bacterium]|nr:hypothetical protein [Bacteroidia bacterium]
MKSSTAKKSNRNRKPVKTVSSKKRTKRASPKGKTGIAIPIDTYPNVRGLG